MLPFKYLLCANVSLVLTSELFADLYYVDILATGSDSGLSWKDAFPDLQDALAVAEGGDGVWVAQGSYTPTAGTDRDVRFFVKAGVALFGGFDTGGGNFNERDPEQFLTILSGEIGSLATLEDNSRNVVTFEPGSSDSLLDGFWVCDGFDREIIEIAPGQETVTSTGRIGAGVKMEDGTVRNCRIENNWAYEGGGVHAVNARLENCLIYNNTANRNGGGVWGDGVELDQCEIRGNRIEFGIVNPGFTDFIGAGGFVRNLTARNCLVAGNDSIGAGGGLALDFASAGAARPVLINCAILNNSGEEKTTTNNSGGTDQFSGSGVLVQSAAGEEDPITMIATLIWGNSRGNGVDQFDWDSPTYDNDDLGQLGPTPIYDSLVESAFYFEGNQITDTGFSFFQPLFVEPALLADAPTVTGDYRPLWESSVVGRGVNLGSVVSPGAVDLAGNERERGVIDMGPYEVPIIFVDSAATGAADGSSWSDAFPSLDLALDEAGEGELVWMAGGLYLPPASSRSDCYLVNEGVSILGGFDGVSDWPEDRDFRTYETIVSGDRGVVGDASDNLYHVFDTSQSDGASLLSGLSISDGLADGAGANQDRGAGLLSSAAESARVEHCRFRNNKAAGVGGAIFMEATTSARIEHCALSGNEASGDGGAIYLENSSGVEMESILLSGNRAGSRGSALFCKNATPILNCATVAGNLSGASGAPIHVENAAGIVRLRNTVAWGNQSGTETGTASGNVAITFTAGSALATYLGCLLEGTDLPQASGLLGKQASNDPLFVNPLAASDAPITGGDYEVALGSPLTDQGDDSVTAVSEDLSGKERVRRFLDIGAYEAGLIHYIKPNAVGDGSGRNWANAAGELASYLNVGLNFEDENRVPRFAIPIAGDEVWVQAGTYVPNNGWRILNPPLSVDPVRYESFGLRSGVKLLGGFNGVVEDLSDRNLPLNESILSGERFDPSSRADNAISIVQTATPIGDEIYQEPLLDGFVIEDGEAVIGTNTGSGGGASVADGLTMRIQNCLFRNNRAGARGGAISVGSTASAVIENCRFEGNECQQAGGAIGGIQHEEVEIRDCVFDLNEAEIGGAVDLRLGTSEVVNGLFRGNTATSFGGCALYSQDEDLKIIGSLFSGNSGSGGTVIEIVNAPAEITNCTMSGNSARAVSGYSLTGTPATPPLTITNSIFWGDSLSPFLPAFIDDVATFSYCLVEGFAPAGTGNLDGTAALDGTLFVNPADPANSPTLAGNYALLETAGVRDVGLDSAISESLDLLGNARFFGQIDMGALEYQPVVVGPLELDDDGDGIPNGIEEAIGTSPSTVDLSHPAHFQLSENGGVSFGVDVSRQGDLIIELVRSVDLLSFPVVVASNEFSDFVPDAQGIFEVIDPTTLPGGRAFYRLRVSER